MELASWLTELDKHASGLQGAGSLIASLAALIAIIATLRSSNRQLVATITTAKEQLGASLQIAEKQLRATVLSSNRQKRNDLLREEIARSVSTLSHMIDIANTEPRDRNKLLVLIREFALGSANVFLLLDPAEEPNHRLTELLRETTFAAERFWDSKDSKELEDNMGQIINLTRLILKREWERAVRLV